MDSLHVVGPRLWLAFGTFCVGVISALAAILFGFLASNASWVGEQASADKIYFGSIGHPQQAAGEERTETNRIREGLTWWWCAVAAATLSIVAFGIGSGLALSAVQLHPPH